MSRICIFIAFVMVTAAYVHHRAQISFVSSADAVLLQSAGARAEAPQVSSIKMDLVAVTP